MKTLAGCLMLTLVVITVPADAQSGGEDPVAALAQELNLSQAQRKKMREIFFQFLDKQDAVPTPGKIMLDNRVMLKEIIIDSNFDEKKARVFVGKVTAVIQDATINRLQLRHDLYRQLTPEQQKQYLEIVQSTVAQMLN